MKALIWKELRENVRWLPVGLFVVAVTCWIVRQGFLSGQALIASSLTTQLAIVAPLLAFALGVVQSFRDLQPAAGAYLNHRSVTASDVFLAKSLSGFAIYAVAITLPILCFAMWIAFQGMDWRPMRPAQVVPALVFGFASFVMHPAAMLMMARGASWWGTKLLPLVPAGAALIPFFAFLPTGGLKVAVICALVVIPMLLWMIAIARQGWRDLQTDPPASRTNQPIFARLTLHSYLIVGILTCLVTAVVFATEAVQKWGRPSGYVPVPYATFGVDKQSGQPWMLAFVQKYNESTSTYTEVPIGGDSIEEGKSVDPFRPLENADRFNRVASLSRLPRVYFQSDGFFSGFLPLDGTSLSCTYDSRGYILCYSRYPEERWTQTIAADGVHPAGQLQGERFTNDALGAGMSVFNIIRTVGFASLLIDSKGVYSLENESRSIRRLIDRPVEAAVLLEVEPDRAPRLVIQSENKLLEYQLLDPQGVDTWYKAPSYGRLNQIVSMPQSLGYLRLTASLVATYDMSPAMFEREDWQVGLGNGSLIAIASGSLKNVLRLSSEGDLETIAFESKPSVMNDADVDRLRAEIVIGGLIPGFVPICIVAVGTWFNMTGRDETSLWDAIAAYPIQATTFCVSFVLVSMLALWLTARISRRRGLSRRQNMAWCWSVLLLGLAAPLSIIAIYRQVHRESCQKCERARRIDTTTCEHCGAPWEPPANEGIEITDSRAAPMVASVEVN